MVENTPVVSEPVCGANSLRSNFLPVPCDAREGAPKNRQLSPAEKNWRRSKTSKSRQS
jgi:hypothetical protein